MGWADEVERCFGVRPTRTDTSAFAEAHRRLDAALSGSGHRPRPLRRLERADRRPARDARPRARPPDERPRRAGARLAPMPAEESVAYELVSGVPWIAFNRYEGEYASRVDVNTDLPISIVLLVELAAHESYPGHHTERAAKEAHLYRAGGRVETAVTISWRRRRSCPRASRRTRSRKRSDRARSRSSRTSLRISSEFDPAEADEIYRADDGAGRRPPRTPRSCSTRTASPPRRSRSTCGRGASASDERAAQAISFFLEPRDAHLRLDVHGRQAAVQRLRRPRARQLHAAPHRAAHGRGPRRPELTSARERALERRQEARRDAGRRRATLRAARPRLRPPRVRPRRRPRAAPTRSRRPSAATSRRRRDRPTTRSGRRCRSSRRARGRAGRGTSPAPSTPWSSGRASAGARPTEQAARSARRRRRARSRSRRPGRPSTCGTAASAPRASRAVQPVHQRMSASVAGPNEPSQRRRSSAWAAAGSSRSSSPPSHALIGTQRYWPLTQLPRGRPRATTPSAASSGSSRLPALASICQRPAPSRTFSARRGSARVRSAVNASPRDSSAARMAPTRSSIQPAGSSRPARRDGLLEPLPLAGGDHAGARRVDDTRPARVGRPTASVACPASARAFAPRTAPARGRPARSPWSGLVTRGRRTTRPSSGARPWRAPPRPGRRHARPGRAGGGRRVVPGALRR